ncbi:MAG: hypothetical protein AAF975_06775 [Spirochaetota bacterium]
MTIKEIVDISGCHRDTVRTAAKKIVPSWQPKAGVTHNFTDKQTIAIMRAIPKREMVGLAEKSASELYSLLYKLLEQQGKILECLTKDTEAQKRLGAAEDIRSETEREIKRLLKKGFSQRTIANILGTTRHKIAKIASDF